MKDKKPAKIVCVDSDGTAIDSMDVKHIKCFGPCFVEVFGLWEHREEWLKRWNEINLYEKTRGMNRFLTLVMILKEVEEKYGKIEGAQTLYDWTERTASLSETALKETIAAGGGGLLPKTLEWSQNTNREIAKLTFEEKKPFLGVREFFEYAKAKADIAVVSSANLRAIAEEWEYFGLDKFPDTVMAQDVGPKEKCLEKLISDGYAPENILMVGDAYPDYNAAKQTGVWFYPIRTRHEEESWRELKESYFDIFLSDRYAGVQKDLNHKFESNFERK